MSACIVCSSDETGTEIANEALTELSTVAEQFILSYKERGKSLPARVALSLAGEGRIIGGDMP